MVASIKTQARSYENLLVWQKSVDLSAIIYQITKTFPKDEIFGLTSQMRRCSVSIPSNIAEGSERASDLEFIRFINIALGSLAELKTQVVIGNKVEIIKDELSEEIKNKVDDISKMLKSLKNKIKPETKD